MSGVIQSPDGAALRLLLLQVHPELLHDVVRRQDGQRGRVGAHGHRHAPHLAARPHHLQPTELFLEGKILHFFSIKIES